jgi:hypothetical protein
MRRPFASADDRLLSQLQAPPDLREGIQSLAYWRQRHERLAWYRVSARREATRMILRWEQRVRGAMLSQRGVPLTLRASAGLLLAQTRLRRFNRRAAFTVMAAVGVTFIALPLVVVVVLLAQIL